MLKGRYIGLRAIERSDLAQLLEWRNQPEFRKYFREYRELNADSQNRWFETKAMNDSSIVMFAIVDLSDGELIGACGLCYIDWVNKSADFSIYIGKDNLYIDNKFAVDAAQVMMKYGFEELNLNRLWSEIYDIDKIKMKFFDILRFKLDGVHRQTHWTGGAWCNSLFYSFLKNEYQND